MNYVTQEHEQEQYNSELMLGHEIARRIQQLPDARSRLAYVAQLSGTSAEHVLERVDTAKELHDQLLTGARRVIQLAARHPVDAIVRAESSRFAEKLASTLERLDDLLTSIVEEQMFALVVQTALADPHGVVQSGLQDLTELDMGNTTSMAMAQRSWQGTRAA